MDLSTFISDTLTQVMKGVVDAQSVWAATGHKGTINPLWGDYAKGPEAVREVSFDVAVTVTSSKEGQAGAKVSVLSIAEVKGDSNAKRENSSVSRVTFSVPIAAPIVFIQPAPGESVHSGGGMS